MGKMKLIALFPGKNYSVDMPLLYYANLKYMALGYDVLKISYGDSFAGEKSYDECLTDIKKTVLQQVADMDFTKYEDIIFVSKSVGTVIAGWLADKLEIKVRHILLTPVKATLPYIKGNNIKLVIAGTKDTLLNAEVLREHCIKEGISLKQFEDVGHGLEFLDDMKVNIEILRQIVDLY